MSLFMDIHQHVPGLTKEAVADAHARDLKIQDKYMSITRNTGLTREAARYSVL